MIHSNKIKSQFEKAGIQLTPNQFKMACSIVDSGTIDVDLMLKQLSPNFSPELMTTSLNVLSDISVKLESWAIGQKLN